MTGSIRRKNNNGMEQCNLTTEMENSLHEVKPDLNVLFSSTNICSKSTPLGCKNDNEHCSTSSSSTHLNSRDNVDPFETVLKLEKKNSDIKRVVLFANAAYVDRLSTDFMKQEHDEDEWLKTCIGHVDGEFGRDQMLRDDVHEIYHHRNIRKTVHPQTARSNELSNLHMQECYVRLERLFNVCYPELELHHVTNDSYKTYVQRDSMESLQISQRRRPQENINHTLCVGSNTDTPQDEHMTALQLATNSLEKITYICDVCNRTFGWHRYLQRHLRWHLDGKLYKCSQCYKSFKHFYVYKQHTYSHPLYPSMNPNIGRTGRKRRYPSVKLGFVDVICQACRQKFTIRDRLRIGACKDPQFKCDVCGRFYLTKYSLGMHKGKHVKSSAFSCDLCNATVYFINDVRIHMTSHMLGKPFQCDLCNKFFTQKVYMNRHKKMHTEKRREIYFCKACKKTSRKLFDPKRRRRVNKRD